MEKPSFLSTSKTSGKSEAAQSSRQDARDPLGRAHDIAKRPLRRIGETMKRGRRDRRVARSGVGDAVSEQRPGSRTGERPIQRDRARPGGPRILWGRHAVAAAIANTSRRIEKLHCTGNAEAELKYTLETQPPSRREAMPEPEVMALPLISQLVPDDAVHQGFVAVVGPLADFALEDLLAVAQDTPDILLVVLDQVTDPHNVGAVLRSAAAFGAAGVIVQSRHAPPIDGVLAKSASGALERVPLVQVTNISRALAAMKAHGIWCVGLAGEAETAIDDTALEGRIALVLGAEGPGMRRLTRENCDQIVRLPTDPGFATLNISNAAAIAFYETRRRKRRS